MFNNFLELFADFYQIDKTNLTSHLNFGQNFVDNNFNN